MFQKLAAATESELKLTKTQHSARARERERERERRQNIERISIFVSKIYIYTYIQEKIFFRACLFAPEVPLKGNLLKFNSKHFKANPSVIQ